MSRPIPETVAPLPLPEGFSDLPPAGKVDAIKELRTDPGTDLYTLQAIAWDALDGTLHDDRKPKRELLSEAGLALLAITDRKDELPANEQALYWDTQLALSTYTAFQARREKQLLGTIARRGIARHAGSIIQEIAEPANFHIADLPYVAAQKAIEAMMISMSALRQRWPFPTVVPSAPPLHRLSHIDRGTNTSAHSLYLLRREESKSEVDLTIPLSVDKIVDVSTYDPKRRRHGSPAVEHQ
ncbi:MAG TPA: hypothetical protein VLF62_03245 [Candidatus Saccharimonadales bacterium]|nr:hypothetical protein [Candidatus Saccharimonadales bacterium]